MLIEQIIEFQLSVPKRNSRTCTLQLVISMKKQKFLKENLPVDSTTKILQKAMYLTSNLTPKCKILSIL